MNILQPIASSNTNGRTILSLEMTRGGRIGLITSTWETTLEISGLICKIKRKPTFWRNQPHLWPNQQHRILVAQLLQQPLCPLLWWIPKIRLFWLLPLALLQLLKLERVFKKKNINQKPTCDSLKNAGTNTAYSSKHSFPKIGWLLPSLESFSLIFFLNNFK